MASKPTNIYRWSEESGGTPHNIVEPSSGVKDKGWLPGKGAIAQFFNWLGNGAYHWFLYLRDGVFVGEAGQPGITATGGTGNTDGGVLTGVGTGNGATITGGSTGKGAVVAAGGGNNSGLESTGAGTGAGVKGTGGATGVGGEFTGGATGGIGVTATGTGNSAGGSFTGNGNGAGASFSASGSGSGVNSNHTGTGSAVSANSGAGSGYGITCTGNATSAPLRLTPLVADPSTPADGDIWYNSTAGKFRGRANGATVDFH